MQLRCIIDGSGKAVNSGLSSTSDSVSIFHGRCGTRVYARITGGAGSRWGFRLGLAGRPQRSTEATNMMSPLAKRTPVSLTGAQYPMSLYTDRKLLWVRELRSRSDSPYCYLSPCYAGATLVQRMRRRFVSVLLTCSCALARRTEAFDRLWQQGSDYDRSSARKTTTEGERKAGAFYQGGPLVESLRVSHALADVGTMGGEERHSSESRSPNRRTTRGLTLDGPPLRFPTLRSQAAVVRPRRVTRPQETRIASVMSCGPRPELAD